MPGRHFYQLGEFRLDRSARVLFRRGELVPLAPKAVDTLLLLVERNGQVVDKDTLLKEIWPDTFVEEGSLTRNISLLRKVFSESGEDREWIETVPKRGYRYVGPIAEPSEPDPAMSVSTEPVDFAAAAIPIKTAPPPGKLHRIAFGFALASAILVAVFLMLRHAPVHQADASPRVMLAVLPVQNLTGDASRDFLTDGLTEELISQLGRLNPQQLGVIARTSSMSFRNSSKNISDIARDLNVDYIVETSLRGTPEQMRFTAQLIRTRDQTHIWAQDFDRESQELVPMEDDIARAVAREIAIQLSPAAHAKIERTLNVKPDSYQSYLLGRYYWNQRTGESMEKGLNYFHEAAHEDPGNARAFAGIADSYNTLLFYGYSNDLASMIRAKAAAEEALKLDDSLPEAHAALGYVNFMWTWEWPEAEKEFRRAIELDQNYVPAHHWYALFLAAMGRAREADQEIRFAETLDPLSPIVHTAAAYIHYYDRKYDEAIEECAAVIARDPNFVVAHVVLGLGYEQKGVYDRALAEFRKTLELSNQNLPYKSYLAHTLAKMGNRAEAEAALADMDESAKRGLFVGQYNKALVYVALGEKDKAFETLGRARQQNDASMIWLGVDPRFDDLRSDGRMHALLSNRNKLP